jgi:adenylate cyclase, class 2
MAGGEENESKHRVGDEAGLVAALAALGFTLTGTSLQRDEYYDSPDRTLGTGDLVCRLRITSAGVEAGFKGPRRFRDDGSHRRIEVEVPVATADDARAALARQGLVLTWLLEKRRRVFRHPARPVEVFLDELPGLGLFVELEGPPAEITDVRHRLGPAIGAAERRNYRELADPTVTKLTFG